MKHPQMFILYTSWAAKREGQYQQARCLHSDLGTELLPPDMLFTSQKILFVICSIILTNPYLTAYL